MHTLTAENFPEFVSYIEAIPLIAGFSLFRGQAIVKNLLPGVGRADPNRNTTDEELRVLDQFAILGASLIPDGRTTLDLLVLAQHYGLRTRLLDWTSNPLAALWFACSDRKVGDAYVYVLDTDNMLLERPYETDPFTVQSTKVFQPRLNNARIVAQHGWFTLHCFSPRSEMWVPLEKHKEIKSRLMQVLIPAKCRKGMLESLDRHGVGARTLFPDLDGLCKHLNWRSAA